MKIIYAAVLALLPLTEALLGAPARELHYSSPSDDDTCEERCEKNECEDECRDECRDMADDLADDKYEWCRKQDGKFPEFAHKGKCGDELEDDEPEESGPDCVAYAKCAAGLHPVSVQKTKYDWALDKCKDGEISMLKGIEAWSSCKGHLDRRRLGSKSKSRKDVCKDYYDCWYDEEYDRCRYDDDDYDDCLDECIHEEWFEDDCEEECEPDCPCKKNKMKAIRYMKKCAAKHERCCKKGSSYARKRCLRKGRANSYGGCCNLDDCGEIDKTCHFN